MKAGAERFFYRHALWIAAIFAAVFSGAFGLHALAWFSKCGGYFWAANVALDFMACGSCLTTAWNTWSRNRARRN